MVPDFEAGSHLVNNFLLHYISMQIQSKVFRKKDPKAQEEFSDFMYQNMSFVFFTQGTN